MQNVIIGTAGHIDHGKTTLIKALTGRNTDTLEEEIKRGISINLGFTYFDLPSGRRAGVIDVPGHERFIKNMIAGAVGVDIVLVTVAANEGIKPQTIEHLDILSYLDMKDAIFVVTKCDLADEILIQLVTDDIEEMKKQRPNSVLSNADIVFVDSLSGKGLDDLVHKIDCLSANVQGRNEAADTRLNIDRVFSIKGFGTVVTGTLVEGKISVGDELMLYPGNLAAKVRNIQVHEENVQTAYAGQRTALNISNLRVEQMTRGNVLAKTGTLTESTMLDVKIQLVAHSNVELKLWSRVRVYLGSREVLARVVPLAADTIGAGDAAFCQLRLEETVVAKKNDKFVIRSYSPMVTIGGGAVLDANPQKHGKASPQVVEQLKIKESGEPIEILENYIQNNSNKYATLNEIQSYMNQSNDWIDTQLAHLEKQGIIYKINNQYFHMAFIDNLRTSVIEECSHYHENFPFRKGMPKEELRSRIFQQVKIKDFDMIIKMFQSENIIKIADARFVALNHFSIQFNKEELSIMQEMEETLLQSGFAPPSVKTLTKNEDILYVEILESMIPEKFIRLDGDTIIHKKIYETALKKLREYIEIHGEISLGDFRDLLGTTRKYAVLILEDFDRNKITKRQEDKRILFK